MSFSNASLIASGLPLVSSSRWFTAPWNLPCGSIELKIHRSGTPAYDDAVKKYQTRVWTAAGDDGSDVAAASRAFAIKTMELGASTMREERRRRVALLVKDWRGVVAPEDPAVVTAKTVYDHLLREDEGDTAYLPAWVKSTAKGGWPTPANVAKLTEAREAIGEAEGTKADQIAAARTAIDEATDKELSLEVTALRKDALHNAEEDDRPTTAKAAYDALLVKLKVSEVPHGGQALSGAMTDWIVDEAEKLEKDYQNGVGDVTKNSPAG